MATPLIKVGIFFGGPSREREISFAGGRTVFDNLDKSLFAPILFFVDSTRQVIELDWHFVYRGTIRDFYPPPAYMPDSPNGFQVYIEALLNQPHFDPEAMAAEIGTVRSWAELPKLIDVAFLALHGHFGEDGQLQGLLQSMDIPYTGSGIRASAIGIDKSFQKKLMHAGGFSGPTHASITRKTWMERSAQALYQETCKQFGDRVVIRPSNQGSSIGVSIIHLDSQQTFTAAVDKAFFRHRLAGSDWKKMSPEEKIDWVRTLADIRDGLGFPLFANGELVYHPEELLSKLEYSPDANWLFEAIDQEHDVLLEGFIEGKEFSCIVIRTPEGSAVALPPTEIIKGGEVFDYRSKYLPGLSRKETPIQLPDEAILAIRSECERLFHYLEFQVYARIDGFYQKDGTICLNDPNTTSGMMPSSFFFHQAAEIGLNPSQFLTYIVFISLQERLSSPGFHPAWHGLVHQLDQALLQLKANTSQRKKVAIILGGYSSERHISVESGRNIFEKLASSGKYDPIPVFLTGGPGRHELFILPINLLLKDNADDICHRVQHPRHHPVISSIRALCQGITSRFAYSGGSLEPIPVTYETLAATCSSVFIALHGRPGEDGEVQMELDRLGLPYNGSDVASSQMTIDKYQTLQTLKAHGFHVAHQFLGQFADWKIQPEIWLDKVESHFDYPFIGKPVDDGCSSAVKIIRNRAELKAYSEAIFRSEAWVEPTVAEVLKLKPKEEFPRKSSILFETLISKGDASHILEITGGLLTHWKNGSIQYELFEPSEALAGSDILSLEEKFLAGEGQNITPARFSKDPAVASRISSVVKQDFEKAARILGVTGYARIDAFVKIYPNDRVETWIIEVNSLPGMTPATCIFHQAAINGYTPYNFIDQILEYSLHARAQNQPV